MSEPWFDANSYAWIPGTVFGVAAGLWGSVLGVFAQRGKGKAVILGWGILQVAVSLGLLIVGVIALSTGQPYGIWYGLGLPGLVGLVVLGGLLPVAFKVYRQAEHRRMQARDFQ